MKQNEKREMKAKVTDRLAEVFEMEGMEVVGSSLKGVAVEVEGTEFWVELTAVVKDPNKMTLDDALREKMDKDAENEAKAKEKAEKKARALAKKEKEGE